MLKETLKLFNAVQVQTKTHQNNSADIFKRTVKHGYLLDTHIPVTNSLLCTIEQVVGISGEKANAAFHKSWKIVQDSKIEDLILQQIMHYVTTYGFEREGIYNENLVYIPHEILSIPEVDEDLPLVTIKALARLEILSKIKELGAGIALAQDTLNAIMVIIKNNNYTPDEFVSDIKNRELKALLFDCYGITPSDPTEFLRHLISKLTGESLIIKNKNLIHKIKAANGKFLDELLKQAPDNLASIFFRFKPLFLAMKSISRNKKFLNQLRRKANKLHKPMPEDFMNNVTARIKRDDLSLNRLANKLENISIFRKIRLAYALKYRLHEKGSIVYRVRNGKGWATDFKWDDKHTEKLCMTLDQVYESIVNDIKPNVEGKAVYIPKNVHYTLPATEKQFTGHLPNGSYVTVPENLTVGIHWTNAENGKRVDLDLSLITKIGSDETGKLGWDANWRTADILFSGDVTTAPKPRGASELFFIRSTFKTASIIYVNYYNFDPNAPVDCKILVAHETIQAFPTNHMVNLNNIILDAHVKISRKQNVLGLVAKANGENSVYFANVSIGSSITSRSDAHSEHARNYLISSMTNSLTLRDALLAAGANVLDKKPAYDHIDLSPQSITKESILNLIQPVQ